MKVFRRDIEVTLKALGVMTLLALIILPVAWGYEQHRQARTWQSVACAYRVKELTRTVYSLRPEPAADACAVLTRLGVSLDPDGFAPPSWLVVRRVAAPN